MPASSKKNFKKRLLIILAILAALLLVMYLLTLILPAILEDIAEPTEEGTADYNFYTPDFDENIYEDEEYMSLIASGILKYDNASNSISDLNDENAAQFGDAVKFLGGGKLAVVGYLYYVAL